MDEKVYEMIAKEFGTTVDEVKLEIQISLDEAHANKDAKIKILGMVERRR